MTQPNPLLTGLPMSPNSRYILPSFEERTSYGLKNVDPYSKLFENRVIFLGTQVDDTSADDIMAQLLVAAEIDSKSDITLYINSPGGSITAMTAILDTMEYIAPDVVTVCLGQAASAAAVILAAGAPGKRFALPRSRVMIHQPSTSGGQNSHQATNIRIAANEVKRLKSMIEEDMANFTGQTPETIRNDMARDKFFTAEAAKEYGIIDRIIRKQQ